MRKDAVEVQNDSDATILLALLPLYLLMLHGQFNMSAMDSLKMTLSEVFSAFTKSSMALSRQKCANISKKYPANR